MGTRKAPKDADTDLAWVQTKSGYFLALSGAKLVCRNKKGARLASVPKAVSQGEEAEQLRALRDFLAEHARECQATVEAWMLRSLPVPRDVVIEIRQDPAWQSALDNAVVMEIDGDGQWDRESAGFLRGADAAKGAGVVTLDGETAWLDAARLVLPHPILIDDIDDFRELAVELKLSQGIQQLFRETTVKPDDIAPGATGVGEFAHGHFEQLVHALGRCRKLGYGVRGGFAVCPVWENDRVVEARYWVGADAPDAPAYTGDLLWVDEQERPMRLADVGPVAYSEGLRMASAIFAARKVESDDAT